MPVPSAASPRDGDFVEYALPFPDDLPEDIVLGPDGNFWFTIDVNGIGRITPEGVVTIFPAPTEDGGPLGIAVGADGNGLPRGWPTRSAA